MTGPYGSGAKNRFVRQRDAVHVRKMGDALARRLCVMGTLTISASVWPVATVASTCA